MLGEHCSSSCPTRDHSTWGECVRGKGLKIGWAASASGLDLSAEKRKDSELALYKQARSEGIQPSGTKRHQIENALSISDATGTAFQA